MKAMGMIKNKFTEEEPLLKVEQLKTYYPLKRSFLGKTKGYLKAVDGVDFDIFPSETLGVVGESGCGKSTLGRTIIGLEKARSGRIIFDGTEITSCSSRELFDIRPKIQMIFQDPYSFLNPYHRIREILAEPLLVHHILPKTEIEKEIDRLLDSVGLPKNCKDRYPNEFSGGQRQRIGIARALALRPKLIICDEPVSALDVSIQAQILNLLKDLQESMNLTYLFIAHGLEAVRYVSRRIVVMYLGSVVEIGPADAVFENPLHPYTQALLDAQPVPDPHQRHKKRYILEDSVEESVQPESGCRFQNRCRFVKDKCRESAPELFGAEHLAACFRFEPSLEKQLNAEGHTL